MDTTDSILDYTTMTGGGDDGASGSGSFCSPTIAMAIVLVLAIIAAVVYYMHRKHAAEAATKPAGATNKASFATGSVSDQLANSGWVFYSRDGCSFCEKQKQVLAELGGLNNSTHVRCGSGGQPPAGGLPCSHPSIKGFPFWYNVQSQESRVGLQDRAALEGMAA